MRARRSRDPEFAARQRQANAQWRAENRERWIASIRRWQAANPDLMARYVRVGRERDPERFAEMRRAHWHRRQALEASRPSATAAEIAALRASPGLECPLCRRPYGDDVRPSIDHIVPLNVGGSGEIDNLRIICLTCNVRRPRDGRDLLESVI